MSELTSIRVPTKTPLPTSALAGYVCPLGLSSRVLVRYDWGGMNVYGCVRSMMTRGGGWCGSSAGAPGRW